MVVNAASLFSNTSTLRGRLHDIHLSIIEKEPAVHRIACILYDPNTDLLKTFINSTISGHSIDNYEYPLADSDSLRLLATTGKCRVINDIPHRIPTGKEHSDWLLREQYNSSFTVPMIVGQRFLGFLFYDSREPDTFTDTVQRDLIMFSNLVVMTISTEMLAVNSLLATACAAKDFAGLRDFETGQHLTRMALFARLIAQGVAKEYQLSDSFVEHLYLFAPLHDIGKIGIPDLILQKPGRLTDEERQIVRTHVDKGVLILKKVLNDYDLSHLSDTSIMLNVVACHHEFLDGSGYPNHLSGEEIPVEARIITVADIFDALTSTRPYKKSWPIDDALEELSRMATEGKLDAHCVQALIDKKAEATQIVISHIDPSN